MNSIEVSGIGKQFARYKKQPGWRGVYKNFFNREYETVEAVKSLTFNIKQGEIIGLIGANGAGKTTTLKMLSGLLTPTAGQIRILGRDPFKKEEAFKKNIALVLGQKQQLWWDIPAIESFKLNKEIYEIDNDEFKETLETLVNLLDVKELIHVPVRNLSLGERMKCELIAGLLHRPQILFLDEPTIGLDFTAQKNIRNFIKMYNKKFNATIIITSHYIADIEALCDRTLFIKEGQIYFDGTLDQFLNDYSTENILKVSYLERGELNFEQFGTVKQQDNEMCQILVPKADASDVRAKLLKHEWINSVVVEQLEAEDIIMKSFEKEIQNVEKGQAL